MKARSLLAPRRRVLTKCSNSSLADSAELRLARKPLPLTPLARLLFLDSLARWDTSLPARLVYATQVSLHEKLLRSPRRLAGDFVHCVLRRSRDCLTSKSSHCVVCVLSSRLARFLDYSTLGVVIGHEIAHSFDALTRRENDSGFGAGNLTWWPSEVNKEYETLTKCFADQFSSYTIESTGESVSA